MENTPEQIATSFFQKQGIPDFLVVEGNSTGWRCRAKLAVRQLEQGLTIGLFQEGSHDIVPLYDCKDHLPRINEAIAQLHAFFLREGILGYNEKTLRGEVRYLQCIVERRTGRVQVSIVINGPYGRAWESRLRRLYQSNIFLWHSFWINVQTQSTNTIFGKEWHHVVGEKFVWESLLMHEIPFLPSHFGQANLEMFERLLEDMRTILPPDQCVAELFSGIGIISIVLRDICRSSVLYEIEPSAYSSFLELRKRLPVDLQAECEFVVGDANTAHEVCGKASTVILDPPRKGVSGAILETIIKQASIKHVLYVSCCWETFVRDAQALLSGGFFIPWARSYKFFPGTEHLETMCLFSRKI